MLLEECWTRQCPPAVWRHACWLGSSHVRHPSIKPLDTKQALDSVGALGRVDTMLELIQHIVDSPEGRHNVQCLLGIPGSRLYKAE